MQISGIRKDILELKRIAALESKQSEDSRIENMTEEELCQAIDDDCKVLGFESYGDMVEYGHAYLEKQGIKFNEYNLHDVVMEHFYDIVTQKRGIE